MALQRQTVALPFATGIDTKTDPKQVQMGKLLALQNGVYRTPKAVSKRYGTAKLGDTLFSAKSLHTYKDELLDLENTGSLKTIPNDSAATEKGDVPTGVLSTSPIVANTSDNYSADSAYANGYWMHSWVVLASDGLSCTLYYSVVDAATGAEVLAGYEANTSPKVRPRCLALGTKLFLIYYWDTAGTMVFRSMDTEATPAIGNRTSIGGCTNTGTFDAVTIGSAIYLAHQEDATTIRLTKLIADGTSINISITAASAAFAITVFADRTDTPSVVLAWNITGHLYYAGYAVADLAEVQAPVDHTHTIYSDVLTGASFEGSSGGEFSIFLGAHYVSGIDAVFKVDVSGWAATPATESAEVVRDVRLVGKAFVDDINDSGMYLPLIHTSSLQSTNFLYNVYTLQWAARWNYGTAYRQAYSSTVTRALASSCMYTNAAGDTCWSMATGVRSPLADLSDSSLPVGAQLTTWNFTEETYKNLALELAGALHFSGPQLTMYDGRNIVEHGFYLWPEGVTVTGTESGGTDDANKYGYVVVYTWVDNLGQVHRSAPSPVVQYILNDPDLNIGVGGVDTTVTIPRLSITNKTGVQAVIYRTEKAGGIYYKLGMTACGPAAGDDDTTFADTVTDASLVAGTTLLYTMGGVMPNACANPCLCPTEFQGRLFYVDSVNRYRIMFSQQVVSSNGGAASPVELVDDFFIGLPETGGPCTGIGVLDEKLIFFKKDRLFQFVGQLPDVFGMNANYTVQQLQMNMGTEEPRSIVSGPDGLFFRSAMGLAMLDRSLQSSLVGYDADGLLTGTVVGAVVVPDQHQVRFTLSGTVTLVYDYLAKQWSHFTHSADGLSAVLYQDLHVRLGDDGVLLQDDVTTYADNGVFVPYSMTTSWVQFSNLQGFQRVRRALLVGECLGVCYVNVSVYYDYQTPVVQTFASFEASPATVPFKHRYDLARQKCSALKLVISDAESSDPSCGMSFSALTFEAGMKQGSDKVPASQAD